jgi:hypothetical protein
MAVRKKILASAVLLMMPFMAARAVQATEQDREQVVAAVQTVADEWNKKHTLSAPHFESALTVVDDTPPYLFQAPDAAEKWLKAYRDNQPPAAAESQTSLRFLEPKSIEINGARAYIAIPAEWTVTKGGKNDVSHGIVTATLNRASQGWLIAVWVWTPQ